MKTQNKFWFFLLGGAVLLVLFSTYEVFQSPQKRKGQTEHSIDFHPRNSPSFQRPHIKKKDERFKDHRKRRQVKQNTTFQDNRAYSLNDSQDSSNSNTTANKNKPNTKTAQSKKDKEKKKEEEKEKKEENEASGTKVASKPTTDIKDNRTNKDTNFNRRSETSSPVYVNSFSSHAMQKEEDQSSEEHSITASANTGNGKKSNENSEDNDEFGVDTDLGLLLNNRRYSDVELFLNDLTEDSEKLKAFETLVKHINSSDDGEIYLAQNSLENYYFQPRNVIFMTANMISDSFTVREKKYTAHLIFKSIEVIDPTISADDFASIYYSGVRSLLPTPDQAGSQELADLYLNLDFAIETKYNDLNDSAIASN